jgi:hypothetical protein
LEIENDMKEAIDRLKLFFAKITEWETRANQMDPGADIPVTVKEDLTAIQAEFCAPGAKVRQLNFSLPPEYSNIEIVETKLTNESKVTVSAIDRRGGLDDRYEFVVVKKKDGWMVSERIFIAFDGKRNRSNL